MSPETQRYGNFAGAGADTIDCPSCGARMVSGMRFCRLCGFRLGEGIEEYTETVRLNGMPPMAPPRPGPTTFNMPRAGATSVLAGAPTAAHPAAKRRGAFNYSVSGSNWLIWVVLAFVIGTAVSVGVLRKVGVIAPRARITAPSTPRSFFGTSGFTYVDGQGLLVQSVLPGGPADLAGLRDGDFVKQFNGRDIASHNDITRALRATPPGTSVPVTVLRDGATVSVTMTTVAESAHDRSRFLPPNGSGYWGVSDMERVAVAGENIYGVRLGDVRANRPADIAGLREGDVVVEFDGRPVRTRPGLESYIDHAAPGTTVEVVVVRDGQRVKIPVKMGRDD